MSALEHLKDLPAWPAVLTEAEALAYTRVSEAQMKEWRRRGAVKFVPRGRHGAAIARRIDLDAAVATLFASTSNDDDDTSWFSR